MTICECDQRDRQVVKFATGVGPYAVDETAWPQPEYVQVYFERCGKCNRLYACNKLKEDNQ